MRSGRVPVSSHARSRGLFSHPPARCSSNDSAPTLLLLLLLASHRRRVCVQLRSQLLRKVVPQRVVVPVVLPLLRVLRHVLTIPMSCVWIDVRTGTQG